MTDKVQKIREEVERLKRWNNNVRDSTRHMTLQEEDFNRGKHSSYLEILNFIDSLQEEPVSEELISVAKQYIDSHVFGNEEDKFTRSVLVDMFCSGAKWKEKKIMANAIDVTVHVDAGGYPYIPQMELYDYDYDNDVPLAKEGDKYKVVLIKEE